MDTFEEIADERRGLADLLAGLTAQQQATQSLCRAWSVHDVLAHLTMPMEVSTPKVVLTMLLVGGNFDRVNQRLTRQLAQRPFDELIDVLRRKADERFTPPGEGPETPLTDTLVHGLDIRWPLHLPRDIPEERSRKALASLMKAPSGLVPKRALEGLRFEATDMDWAHGAGPTVAGKVDALLLAVTGRTIALESLSGDGLSTFRDRITPRQVSTS